MMKANITQLPLLLRNPIQAYAWGSKVWIQDLLDLSESERQSPMAELWMGAHTRSPSRVVLDSTEKPLDEFIQENRLLCLGEIGNQKYTGLPFLFKLLAADAPLSIQAHPNEQQAKDGFAREEKAGIPLSAENRNYKDPNHKPEIICALTNFTAMCGFRYLNEIISLVSLLEAPQLHTCLEALNKAEPAEAYKDFLHSLFSLPQNIKLELTERLKEKLPELIINAPSYALEWKLIEQFAAAYPGDSAIIAPLYLNVLSLKPGEALFLPAGILHAYVHGFGVELMANSDNVLRGGLTPKYVDVKELLNTLRFEPYKPEILQPITGSDGISSYPSPVDEFSLFRIDLKAAYPVYLPAGKPIILIMIEGSSNIENLHNKLELTKGKSVFIPAVRDELLLSGSGTLFGATTGA
ncbi:mannose-6-phosphate isomerase, class I [Gracilinema caldarium]|uniref:mannose-6-phosphate isomerase, class I n=1 Tax=Gracilinema caldarium TaxID=215591 RepID=UPI0026F03039|nr:mannose-6-phosphate isomerase, class I [Gracilinema caldarium]